jgi:hypothetical protein
VFTARYGLSPYIKQTRFVFKKLNDSSVSEWCLLVFGGIKRLKKENMPILGLDPTQFISEDSLKALSYQ